MLLIILISLLIPTFIFFYKDSFDELVSSERSQVKGINIINVKKVEGISIKGQEQTVFINLGFPFIGEIFNRSQAPFKFPTPANQPDPILINNMAPISYPNGPNDPVYIIGQDSGRGESSFLFAFGGIKGNYLSFYNGNSYDLNEVIIELTWRWGQTTYVSTYSTPKIKSGLSYYVKISNTSQATIPYNPSQIIDSMVIRFKDNSGVSYLSSF